jgi:hypothetical protein
MQHIRHTVTQFAMTALVATLPFGCSTDDPPDGSGGTGAVGSGGLAGLGGAVTGGAGGTGGTGGSSGSGGAGGKGGAGGVGGSVATGGSAGTGGSATGGMAGASGSSGASGTAGAAQGGGGAGGLGQGGSAGVGGAVTGGTGGAGAGGGAGTGGGAGKGGSAGAGGTGSGTCQKGTTQGDEVLFIGESFVANSSIPEETAKLAKAAGSLGANDSYVDKSVAGTWVGNGASNSIPAQYRNNSDGVRFVVMNGGGNDCWQGGQASHRTAALSAVRTLFEDMAENGVEKVVYHFYPDPIDKNPGQYASLRACLDLLRPEMKQVCDSATAPKCYWVDLRETWEGHPEYTSDGIHVAGPGNAPTAGAIWEAMEANCVAP